MKFLLICISLFFGTYVSAQDTRDTTLRTNFEKTLYQKEKLKVNAFLGLDHNENMSNRKRLVIGPRVKYKLFQNLDVGCSYRYFALTEREDAMRAEIELTPHKSLTDNFKVDLRNRYECFFLPVANTSIQRMRHRLRLTQALELGGLQGIFTSHEVFYRIDQQSSGLHRNSFIPLGLKFAISEKVKLDFYYLWEQTYAQNDREHTNHILALALYF